MLDKGFYQGIPQEHDFGAFTNYTNSCLLYGSVFLSENTINVPEIILEENFRQSFLFNSNYSNFKYNYYFFEKDKNIKIEFILSNKVEYKMNNIFINDNKYDKSYNIDKNQNITIDKKLWNDICNNEKQICKLSFNILLKNKIDKNVLLEINLIQVKAGLSTILIVIFSVIGLIILIVIVFIIFRCIKKRKDDLKSNIENIPEGKESELIN
jgi:hypothetical protein